MSNVNQDSDSDLVPCELCNCLVQFSDYEQHVQTCVATTRPFMLIYRENNDVYEINITPVIQALQELPSRQDAEHETENEDRNEDDYRPTRSVHTSLVVIPRVPNFSVQDDNESNYRYYELISNLIGKVKVSLSNPEVYIEKIKANVDDRCPICQDTIIQDQAVETKLCNHKYCKCCILKWFEENVRCPICNCDQRVLLQTQSNKV